MGYLIFLALFGIYFFFKTEKDWNTGQRVRKQEKPYQPGLVDNLLDDLIDKFFGLPIPLMVLVGIAFLWIMGSLIACIFTFTMVCPFPLNWISFE